MEKKAELRSSTRKHKLDSNEITPLKKKVFHESSDEDKEWFIEENDMEYNLWNRSTDFVKNEIKENSFILHNENNKPCIKKQKCEYICGKCNEAFDTIRLHNAHIKTHNADIQCKHCNEVFQNKKLLIKHMKSYHNLTETKKYQCTICKKIVTFINEHMKIHSEPTFSCEHCEKKFTKKTYYTEHLRCHTGEKPYKCKICGNEFSKKYNFNGHLKRHEIYRDDFGNYLQMKQRGKSTKKEEEPKKIVNSVQCGTSDHVDLELIWANSKCCGTNDQSNL